MKKILLASTILVGTAGYAAADVSFSGSAYVGVGYNITTSTFAPEVTADFTAAMSTMTDGGLEAGASITVTAGGVSFDDDYTDATFGISSMTTAGVGDATVYLSGDFGKIEAAYDNNGATTTYDVTLTYTNTWGDFGLMAYYTISPGVTNGDLGASGSYSFGDYSVYATYDYDASLAEHTVGGGAEATFSGVTVGADASYNITTSGPLEYGAHASYATGPYTIGVQIDRDTTVASWDYGATASYDLGGGVAVEGAFMHDATTTFNLVTVGVSMAF